MGCSWGKCWALRYRANESSHPFSSISFLHAGSVRILWFSHLGWRWEIPCAVGSRGLVAKFPSRSQVLGVTVQCPCRGDSPVSPGWEQGTAPWERGWHGTARLCRSPCPVASQAGPVATRGRCRPGGGARCAAGLCSITPPAAPWQCPRGCGTTQTANPAANQGSLPRN